MLHCEQRWSNQTPAEVEEQPFKHQHWPRTAENDQWLPTQETEDGSSDRCTQKALQHTLHPTHNEEESKGYGKTQLKLSHNHVPCKEVCLSMFKSIFGWDKLSLRGLKEIHHRSQTYFVIFTGDVWEETRCTYLQGIISQRKLPTAFQLTQSYSQKWQKTTDTPSSIITSHVQISKWIHTRPVL